MAETLAQQLRKSSSLMDRAAFQLSQYQLALEKIRAIPRGPDRGSAQSQIDLAVWVAEEALREIPARSA